MSTYKGWAIKLANGDFMDDTQGMVGCAVFKVKRAATMQKNMLPLSESRGAKIVSVTVTVKEIK